MHLMLKSTCTHKSINIFTDTSKACFYVYVLTLSFSKDLHASARRLRLLSYTLSSTMDPGVAVAVREIGSPGSE